MPASESGGMVGSLKGRGREWSGSWCLRCQGRRSAPPAAPGRRGLVLEVGAVAGARERDEPPRSTRRGIRPPRRPQPPPGPGCRTPARAVAVAHPVSDRPPPRTPPGEPELVWAPVSGGSGGRLVVRCNAKRMEAATELTGRPLPERQRPALDVLKSVPARPARLPPARRRRLPRHRRPPRPPWPHCLHGPSPPRPAALPHPPHAPGLIGRLPRARARPDVPSQETKRDANGVPATGCLPGSCPTRTSRDPRPCSSPIPPCRTWTPSTTAGRGNHGALRTAPADQPQRERAGSRSATGPEETRETR